ncbi:hypothetical protein ACFXHD_09765 [Streptomyces hydrogenans]|uniref:hypothetical protein n=1 Tax=Streptomyces hydrogenans TaxID=1873719 RepID=UPI003692A08B
MKTSERLLARLREIDLDLPEGTRLVRVYPSPAMRTEGSWTWTALGPGGRDLRIGSQHSMATLLGAEMLLAEPVRSGVVDTDIDVVPARPCRQCATATETACRICRGPFCQTCFTDHHHEGYGTPAEPDW